MVFENFFPISTTDSYEVTKSKIFVYILLACILFQSLIWAYLSLTPGMTAYFPFGQAIVLYIAVLALFRKTQSLFICLNLILAFFFYQYANISLETGGIYSTETFFLCLFPVTALILLKAGSAIFWFVIVNIWSIYLFSLTNSSEQIQFFKNQTLDYQPDYYLMFHICRSMALFVVVFVFYFQNQKLIKRLKGKQKALEQKNIEHEKLNKELKITQERLKDSNKELEQYAHTTSHDLKQPIRTVNSFATLLKMNLEKRGVLDDESDEFLGFITKGAKNMLTLVTDLLAYAKLAATKDVAMKTMQLNDVVDKVLGGLRNQINTNQVSIERADLPKADVVPTKIDQVFQNIISNAIKFKKKDEPLTIKILSEKKGSHWELTIEDNGIGIDKHQQERIFAPFEKLHSQQEYEGSGIGLATCKRIIEMHKGKIWVESEKDKGTKFFFTLPKGQDN